MHFKILSRGLVAVIGCVAFAGAASDALAQQNSMFGANSPTNGANGMGTASAGAAFQSSAFPSSTFPAGGAATGAGGMGGQPGFGGQPGMGATGQQSGLIGLSPGTNLIGTGAPAGQNPMGQTGMMNNRQGMQNRNNANRRTGQNRNQANQAGAGAANQQQRTVRPQMLVAFDHPRPDAETTQTAITTRFAKLASKTQFKDIEVETDGSIVTLRGQVDSDRTSRLATILARMEPGVSKVRNELTIAEAPSPGPSATE